MKKIVFFGVDIAQIKILYKQTKSDMDLATAHSIIGLLLPLCEQLSDRVAEQDQQIQGLSLRIKQLEDQLATNSKNSSKPPSSDGFKSPKDRSLRKSSGKKPGGQKGHEGQGGKLFDDPDETFKYSVDHCPDCDLDLSHHPADELLRKQLVDIPPVKPHVTEYQIELKSCPCCGRQWRAAGCPAGIYHELEYGPGVCIFRSKFTHLFRRNFTHLFRRKFTHLGIMCEEL